jgi:hypothetical protein
VNKRKDKRVKIRLYLRRKVVRTTKRGKLQNMENQSHGI